MSAQVAQAITMTGLGMLVVGIVAASLLAYGRSPMVIDQRTRAIGASVRTLTVVAAAGLVTAFVGAGLLLAAG